MAIRYLITKHLSLGLGVLIKREQNDVGKIFFGEDKATRDVLLTHPHMSVASNVSLTKFVSLSLFEGIFDELCKKSAQNYVENAIKDMHVSENECYGFIIDTKEYAFRISIDNNSFINLSCGCPLGDSCKHLYAVFLKMKQLLDKNSNKVVVNQNISTNDFRDLLERFFYVRGGDNIPLIGKLNHRIKNIEKCRQFIEQLTPYYLRGQYKARAINDVLAPLFFNEKNATNFDNLMNSISEDGQNMIKEARAFYSNLKSDFEKRNIPSKKANLYHIMLAPDCQGLVNFLIRAEDNFNEERLANQVMVEYLKYQELTIEDVYLLKSTYLFQMNHQYYISEIMNGPAKGFSSTYLLFFDALPYNESKIKQIPLDYFLKVSAYSNDKSRYIPIVYDKYEQIEKEQYPILVELLVGVSLQHDFIDERVIRLAIELSKKIPFAHFVNELVETNIRRPKKQKTY